MTDTELNAKIAVLFAGIVVVGAVAYFAVIVLIPLFVIGVIVDAFMRSSYKGKVAAAKAKGGLLVAPVVHDFEARLHDGEILIAWNLELPDQAYMDIYRLVGQNSGDLEEITSRGVCIHSTGVEATNSKADLFTDHDAPEGVLYYIPVLYGKSVEKRILDYGFFSFYASVQYTTRRNSVVVQGHASRVVNEIEAPLALPDVRGEAEKMADEILTSIKARKAQNAELDGAIARIKASPDLSDAEKLEAIELLETRATGV